MWGLDLRMRSVFVKKLKTGRPGRSGRSLQGLLTHKKDPPPYDHHRSLGIGLLWGPRDGLFLIGEVPLYTAIEKRPTLKQI